MYGEGRGVKRDLAEAARLFKLVVEQGLEIKPIDLGIMNERLGFMCEHGLGGVERDLAEATRLYTLAVDQGNRNAQWRLGAMYEEGRGVARDLGKAAKLLTLAAPFERGDVVALKHPPPAGSGCSLCIVSSCAECVPPAEGAWTVSTFCGQHNGVPAATFVRAEISKHGHLAFDRVCDESIYYHYPVSADKWRSPDAPIPLPPE